MSSVRVSGFRYFFLGFLFLTSETSLGIAAQQRHESDRISIPRGGFVAQPYFQVSDWLP